jgi:hypothetical protein
MGSKVLVFSAFATHVEQYSRPKFGQLLSTLFGFRKVYSLFPKLGKKIRKMAKFKANFSLVKIVIVQTSY